jgi:enoyl-CoA hydratase/carnithine racemase
MLEAVVVSKVDRTLRIHLDRADKRNAVTLAMYEAMAQGIAQAEADDAIRVVLFTGAGDAFCAGNDLNEFLAEPPTSMDSPGFRFLRAISTASKVIVAAVHGSVVGIGMTMLLHCDLVVAARSARLSIPFAKLGLVPEAASTLLLPRAIGHRRAAELVLLGDPIDAETALEWGLVNRVVDDQTLLDAARELTSRIGSLPPSAIRVSKELLRDDRAGIALRIQQEGSLFLAQLRSPEFQEAGTAFLEKRPADFSRFK